MRKIEYVIQDITIMMSNTVCLNLVPKNKDASIKFRSGQYGLISFLRRNVLSAERPFSFASSMLHRESLQFGFRVCGQFTGEMAKLKKGDSVFVRGPFGSFIYNERKYKNTVFLAAGIGITPFLSAIRYASEKALPNKMALVYSNNFVNEIPFYKELRGLAAMNPNFQSYFLITKPEADLNQNLFIPGRINKSVLITAIKGNPTGKTFFICGPEAFTIAAIDLLTELGVKESNIKTEGFSQTPISFFEKGTGFFPLVAGTSAMAMLAMFFSINQIETTKAFIKSQDQQVYSQQLITEQQAPQLLTQTQDLLQQQDPQLLSVQLQDTQQSTQQLDPQPQIIQPIPAPVVTKRVARKTKKSTTVTSTTPEPVYTPPAPVYTPPTPVYTPPPAPVYTPPPAPVYTPPPAPVYTPPAPVYVPQTRTS